MSAILTSRPNSHPFQERHLSLHEPVKIGRCVARSRPAANNAIFDCKVLSRNHALMWYEDHKFYLQDTKSANGTFVNNRRLSKGSEESAPHEIFSGDPVQFGVDVMENSRRVTHSCIIVTLQLFHSDGSEALPNHSIEANSTGGSQSTSVQSQEVFQLAQYLQEALHREQMLENKLSTLQHLVENGQEQSSSGWQALIDEDRLLSRLELLENQLAAYSKNQSEDTLRQELVALQEDKFKYETTAKESLRKVLQEKLEAVQKLSDLERSLCSTQDECAHQQEMCEAAQRSLTDLAEQHQQQLQQVETLQAKLEEANKRQEEDLEQWEKEKADLNTQLQEATDKHDSQQVKIESLEAENDFTKEQKDSMKAELESVKSECPAHLVTITNLQNQLNMLEDAVANLNIQLSESRERADSSTELAQQLKEQLSGLGVEPNELQPSTPVKEVKPETISTELKQTSTLQQDVNRSNGQTNMEDAVANLNIQLNESRERADNSAELARQLKEQVAAYEAELAELRATSQTKEVTVSSSDLDTQQQEINRLTAELEHVKSESHTHQATIANLQDRVNTMEDSMASLNIQLNESRERAEESTELARQLKEQNLAYESELTELRATLHSKEVSPVMEKTLTSSDLPHTTSLQQEINRLNELLQEARDEQNRSKEKLDNADEKIVSLQDQLEVSVQEQKKNLAEADQLRGRLRELQEELEVERLVRTSSADQHSKASEIAGLKEKCDLLKEEISHYEANMTSSKHELSAAREELETSQMMWRMNLTDAQKEAENTKTELGKAREEVSRLNEEVTSLQEALSAQSSPDTDYDELAFRARTLSTVSMVPLFILLLAVFLAFSPFLSTITATS